MLVSLPVTLLYYILLGLWEGAPDRQNKVKESSQREMDPSTYHCRSHAGDHWPKSFHRREPISDSISFDVELTNLCEYISRRLGSHCASSNDSISSQQCVCVWWWSTGEKCTTLQSLVVAERKLNYGMPWPMIRVVEDPLIYAWPERCSLCHWCSFSVPILKLLLCNKSNLHGCARLEHFAPDQRLP